MSEAANRAYLALGSNIEPEVNLPRCAALLAGRCCVLAVSRVYETSPVGFAEQANFLNAAVLVEMKEDAFLVPATTQDQNVLGLAEGAEVLVVDRIALSASGWPLVWAEIRIRPDRFEYVAALWPEGAKLLQ